MNNIDNDSMISKTNIIDVNADTFMTEVIEASKEKPIIVDFWAPWCEPCKQLTPILENAVKDQREKITLAKIDIDQNQDIAAQSRIQSIPTVYTFFEGKVADGFQGVKTNSEILWIIFELYFLKTPRISKNIIDNEIKISGNINSILFIIYLLNSSYMYWFNQLLKLQ